jgi:DNA replication protein DnaC
MTQTNYSNLLDHLEYLKLRFIKEHCQKCADEAARLGTPHIDYLSQLIEGEAHVKHDAKVARRIKSARFPVLKSIDNFLWSWPTSCNELQIKNLFRLAFLENFSNVIFLGGVGLGKTHLSIALGYTACLKGRSVLFATAIDTVNALIAAQAQGRLRQELSRYLKPDLLILDEFGYLPVDKTGADLLFQIISQRYERGSLIITSNRPYKKWHEIFNNDATMTSAALDRLLHHAETIKIEGNSFRMKDQLQES